MSALGVDYEVLRSGYHTVYMYGRLVASLYTLVQNDPTRYILGELYLPGSCKSSERLFLFSRESTPACEMMTASTGSASISQTASVRLRGTSYELSLTASSKELRVDLRDSFDSAQAWSSIFPSQCAGYGSELNKHLAHHPTCAMRRATVMRAWQISRKSRTKRGIFAGLTPSCSCCDQHWAMGATALSTS